MCLWEFKALTVASLFYTLLQTFYLVHSYMSKSVLCSIFRHFVQSILVWCSIYRYFVQSILVNKSVWCYKDILFSLFLLFCAGLVVWERKVLVSVVNVCIKVTDERKQTYTNCLTTWVNRKVLENSKYKDDWGNKTSLHQPSGHLGFGKWE